MLNRASAYLNAQGAAEAGHPDYDAALRETLGQLSIALQDRSKQVGGAARSPCFKSDLDDPLVL